MLGAWTVVGVGVSVHFAVRLVTGPLSDLTQMAQHLGEGQLGERICVPAGGEIGQLAMTFNNMAASLKAA